MAAHCTAGLRRDIGRMTGTAPTEWPGASASAAFLLRTPAMPLDAFDQEHDLCSAQLRQAHERAGLSVAPAAAFSADGRPDRDIV